MKHLLILRSKFSIIITIKRKLHKLNTRRGRKIDTDVIKALVSSLPLNIKGVLWRENYIFEENQN